MFFRVQLGLEACLASKPSCTQKNIYDSVSSKKIMFVITVLTTKSHNTNSLGFSSLPKQEEVQKTTLQKMFLFCSNNNSVKNSPLQRASFSLLNFFKGVFGVLFECSVFVLVVSLAVIFTLRIVPRRIEILLTFFNADSVDTGLLCSYASVWNIPVVFVPWNSKL